MRFFHFCGRKQGKPKYSIPNSTYFLPAALRDSFRECVQHGDIESLVQKLNKEPLLSCAKATWPNQETPLLVASVHPDAQKAVEMIDLLMEEEAELESCDRHQRNVLLYACHHGVEWIVVECLLKWNASKGEGVLKWSDCDDNGHSSLLLACLGGHTELALHLLDEIDIEEYVMQNHPFHVLGAVIKSRREAHALAIAGHPKIQAAIGAADMLRYKDCGGSEAVYTLRYCVVYAVKREMTSVLRLMDNLNHPKVSKVTWYTTFGKFRGKPTNPVILGIACQFAKDRQWDEVKGLFLLRYRTQDIDIVQGQLRVDLLARLPDHLFRLIVEFTKLSMTRRSDVGEISWEIYMEMLL